MYNQTKQTGLLLVLSGPSGAGKGSISKYLLNNCPKLKFSVSATTRQPRVGEVDKVNYHFMNKEKFQQLIEKDEFLEYAQVYDNFYGTPKQAVDEMLEQGFDVLLEIDPQGAMQIKEKMPHAVFVFIMPPSLQELSERIHKRGTDEENIIQLRLSKAVCELKCASQYDYLIINDEVELAANKVISILEAERCLVGRNINMVSAICSCE